jgi:hypothetical protein
LNIQFFAEKAGKTKIRMLNSAGILVRETIITSEAKTMKYMDFDIGNLPNGSYIVHIINDDGNIKVKKIQKFK